MARWYWEYAPADSGLAGAEGEARAAKRGLWSQPDAVPPWDWRRGKGTPSRPAWWGIVGAGSTTPRTAAPSPR
jgi:hypothetical protein